MRGTAMSGDGSKGSLIRRLSTRCRRRASSPRRTASTDVCRHEEPLALPCTTSKSTSTTCLHVDQDADVPTAAAAGNVGPDRTVSSDSFPADSSAGLHGQPHKSNATPDDDTADDNSSRKGAVADQVWKPVDADETRVDADATTLSSLNKVLLSRLECPVCYQYMLPPIRQCRNGHCVCAACHHKLVHCPTCRDCFLAAPNLALSEIAAVVLLPCRHRSAGCSSMLRLQDKAAHEEGCPRREFACPMPSTTPGSGAAPCAWKVMRLNLQGRLEQLLKHASDDHPDGVTIATLNQYTEMRYSYSRTQPIEESGSQGPAGVSRVVKTVLLRDAANRGEACEVSPARVILLFHLRFDATLTVLHAALQLLGPSHFAMLLSYKVVLQSSDGTFSLSAWSEVSCADVDEIIKDGKVLRVDRQAFPHFVGKDGKFRVKLKLALRRLPPYK